MATMNPPLRTWTQRSVWLIGASSGIGLATAHALHAAGARVVVSARQGALLDQFVATHPGAYALTLDVTDAQAMRDAAERVKARQGLDVVVYCAGYYQAQSAQAYDLHSMQTHLSVNYTGALLLLDIIWNTITIRVLSSWCSWASALLLLYIIGNTITIGVSCSWYCRASTLL